MLFVRVLWCEKRSEDRTMGKLVKKKEEERREGV